MTTPTQGVIPENDHEMTLIEHLQELRHRLVLSLIPVIPGIFVSWSLKERFMAFLVEPLVLAYKMQGIATPKLHFANPVDPFVEYLKMSLVGGFLMACPWVFYQLWLFVAPALYPREKRLAIPFATASALFFIGGAFFGYKFVFPLGFNTFLSFAGPLPDSSLTIEPTLMINEYLSFATRLLIAFGVVFEVPVVVTFLAFAGLVNWKQLLAFSRWWIVISTVLAAVLTPGPDVGSQLLMAIPLIVLYFASILLAYLFGPKPDADGADTSDVSA